MAKRRALEDFDVEGFQWFWSLYPRRDARLDAWKAWCQTRPNADTRNLILGALDWQIPKWAKDNFEYAPLPATYLRNQRWTDERRNGERRMPPQKLSNVTAAALQAIRDADE